MPIAVEYLCVGGDEAVLADGYFLIGMNACAVNSGTAADFNHSAFPVQQYFAAGMHVNVIPSVGRIDGYVVADNKPRAFCGIYIRHVLEIDPFAKRYFTLSTCI